MTAEGELERLDQQGRQAAHEARRFDDNQNRRSNALFTASWQDMQFSRHSMPVVGRLACTIAIWFVFKVTLVRFGVPYSSWIALGMTAAMEGGWYLNRVRKLRRLRQQQATLNARLHDLKQQNFELRYEEAKRNGDLDRFASAEKT